MKKPVHLALMATLILLLSALTLFPGSAATAQAEEVTLVGTVQPGAQLATEDEVYLIREADKGQELIEMIDQKVEVTGTLSEFEGKTLITVTEFVEVE